MKKMINVTVVAFTCISFSNSFGMLTRVIKTRPHSRAYHRKTFVLPEKNIFNTKIDSTSPEKYGLLEDVFDRNNCAIEKLKHLTEIMLLQNNLAVAHTYHEAPLDLQRLRSLEKELQENSIKLFPNNTKGRADDIGKLEETKISHQLPTEKKIESLELHEIKDTLKKMNGLLHTIIEQNNLFFEINKWEKNDNEIDGQHREQLRKLYQQNSIKLRVQYTGSYS